jgi:hypothetical protein
MKNAKWKILAGLGWGLMMYGALYSESFYNAYVKPVWWILPLTALLVWGWIVLPVVWEHFMGNLRLTPISNLTGGWLCSCSKIRSKPMGGGDAAPALLFQLVSTEIVEANCASA